MKYEKSSGAIIFRIEKGEPFYLLLYGPSYWGFSKGQIEKSEGEEQTAIREAQEESGLKIEILKGFKEKIKYMYKLNGELISKQVVFFVAKTNDKKVKISKEHEDFKWVSLPEALQLMKHKNQKEILKKADKFIRQWTKQKRLE
ncbi:diadenosine tetraphosphate hydrolase [Candidatus Pacearchaeota archaeon ex4484_26]|nr:MAG: diadenosine tetraphosphate hydrolase [Candidatus Pacearchaeota archaeon ex4484_26]